MDKSEGGSSMEQFDLNKLPEEEKDDHGEQNPNVQFGVDNTYVQNQRNSPQGPNPADQIRNTGHIGSSSRETTSYRRHTPGQYIHGNRPVASSSHGMMSNQRNVLGQFVHGNRPGLTSSSSSLGTNLNQWNVLGQGRIRPGLNSASSSLGMMLNQRNVSGQGVGGTQPVLNSSSSRLETLLNQLDALGEFKFDDGTIQMFNSTSSYVDKILYSMAYPSDVLGESSDGTRPVVNSASSGLGTRPPTDAVALPGVQMEPPMVEMHPPVVQTDSHRGFVHDPTSPSTNINLGIRSPSYSDEDTSQHRRPHDDEPESSSRVAKRSKR